MPRKESKAVSEGKSPVPQQEEFGSGQPTLEEISRMIKETLKVYNRSFNKMKEYMEEQTSIDQRLTRLEYDARQLRLAMGADGLANTKPRKRTEGAATAVQAMHGDSFSSCRIDPGPKTLTSFGVKAEPPTLPCRDEVVVKSGNAAPKSCLPSLEMRTKIAAGGLVPTGKTSIATETNFNQPPLRFYSTEETDSEANCKKGPTPFAFYDNSFWKLLAAPYCRRVIETKSRQNRTFDAGGSQGHLRACPFLESWRAMACGEVMCAGAAGDELQRFFGGDSLVL